MRKTASSKPAQRGISVVEILIALFLISGGIAALVSFQSRSLKEGNIASQRLEAATLAQQQLDVLRNYSTGAEFDAIVANTDVDAAANQVPGRSTTFTRIWDVTDLQNGDKQVTVSVLWPDNQTGVVSRDTTVELSSRLTAITHSMENSPAPAGAPEPDVIVDVVDCQCNGTTKSGGGGHGGHGGHMSGAQLESACDTCCSLTTSGSKGMMARALTIQEFYASLSRNPGDFPQSRAQPGWQFFHTAGMTTTKTCEVRRSGMVMMR